MSPNDTAGRLQPDRAREILDRCGQLQIAVVGDVVLDEYLIGHPERLSREGPVPVLAFDRRVCLPGGAANPARNVAALGGRAVQVGVVGDDPPGQELADLLQAAGIATSGLVVAPGRATTVKTRIVAEGPAAPHQLARIDRQERRAVNGDIDARLARGVASAGADADAILVSDYKSGVVTDAVRAAARQAIGDGRWLTADTQGDLERFEGFGLVRAALRDAEASLGRRLPTEHDVEAAARDLRQSLDARVVVISRGAEGMSVLDATGYSLVRPNNVSEVFDVTGAGDTVIAVLTLALSAGAEVREAVELANRAAGLVVRRLGVAAPTAEEILGTYD